MLSDEEKKAINNLNFIIVTDIYDNEVSIDKTKIINEYNESVGIVLNLIRKQSKEIEELKAISEYREKIIKGLGLKTLPKTITGFKQLIENNDKKWKDKIKAKIEELDKEEKDLQNSISDEEREEYSDANISWKLMDIQIRREVLQSLLEKE